MVSAPGAIAAGATTAPAMLGVTWPGLYGTHEEIQVPVLTLPKTPLIVSSALYTFTPQWGSSGRTRGSVGRWQADDEERRAELRLRLGEEVHRHAQRLPQRRCLSVCHVAIGTLDPMQACWPVAS